MAESDVNVESEAPIGDELRVFAGGANPHLADESCSCLGI